MYLYILVDDDTWCVNLIYELLILNVKNHNNNLFLP